MTDVKNASKRKSHSAIFKFALFLFFILLILLAVRWALSFYSEQGSANADKSASGILSILTPEKAMKSYEDTENPAIAGAVFFEKLPKIKTEQTYLAYPMHIDPASPPTLIVYSHGSNTTVTTKMNDQFMKDMRAYGAFFTERGYAFSASAMHGANWGSAESQNDMNDLAGWVKDNYSIAPKINVLGFSMGGLSAIGYSMRFPEKVNKLALLAPTSRPEKYTAENFTSLKNIPIKIWHGDKDLNVPYSLSTRLVSAGKKNGKEISLVTLAGKGHFDIDTEYMGEVYSYFQE